MISEDIRFVAGEDIKKGDVVKYDERVGIICSDSNVIPGDCTSGPRVVPAQRPSPYNAKPVPRFEVEQVQYGHLAGCFKVVMSVDEKEVGCEYVQRTWFRKNQAAAILAAQRRMAEDYAMTQRFSGSVETLAGVRLV